MAEGLLDGVLGGEEEKVDATQAGSEPLAAAIAAAMAKESPEVAAETAAFLRQQTKVLLIQEKNLEAEYEFFEAEWAPRLLALRLRTTFQICLALFAVVIGVGLGLIVYSAVKSHSVVIDPFEISPNAVAEVPSGKIVAAGLLDALTRIQAASRANIEHRNLSNAWTGEISIDVPEAGISIGELERTIKARFGHDQRIEGDVVKNRAGGLALTVRGNGILARTFNGDAAALDELETQAGEYVFSQSQPGLWVAYLSNNDRNEEAARFARDAYNTVEASEKPYVLNYWANAMTSKGGPEGMNEALTLYRETLRLKPDYWIGYSNVMYALSGLGREEEVARTGEAMTKAAGGRPGRAPEEMYQNYDQMVWYLTALRDEQIADIESHGGIGATNTAGGSENLSVVQSEILMHDVEAASLRLKTAPVDEKVPGDVAMSAMAWALLAEETGDLPTAVKHWDAFAAAYADPSVSTSNPSYTCYSAVAYEKAGQSAKADAALNAVGGLTLLDCYRFRADVLDLRGDWSGAQLWYENAVKLAPSLPAGYYSWGLALAKHGNLDAAASRLNQANQKGPHWADPLKAWGDVLVKQGRADEALEKYNRALKLAPNWKELKDARAALAKT